MIKDSFSGEGIHRFELNFHFHPDTVLTGNEFWWEVDNQGEKIFITFSDNEKIEHIRGETDPISGWYSAAYGIKEPCSVLRCSKKCMPDEVEFFTTICTDSPSDAQFLQDKFYQIEKQAENS